MLVSRDGDSVALVATFDTIGRGVMGMLLAQRMRSAAAAAGHRAESPGGGV